jgi:signal transduction histidine kinase
MQPHLRTAMVAVVGVALVIWSTFGPFLVWAGPYHWSVTPANATINLGFGLLWVAVLVIAVHRDPGGRMWKLLLLYLAAQGHWVLGYVQTDWAWTAAQLFGPLPAAILLHLVLGFPDGRLRDRFDQGLVGLVYVIAIPVQVLGFLVWDPAWVDCGPSDWCPNNVLLIARNDDLYVLIGRVGLLSPILAVLAVAETIRHWRRAMPAARRALTPVALGMPLVFLQLGIWFLAPTLDRDDIRVFILENKVFDLPSYLTPSLFLMGILQSRLARGSIADLAVELGRGIPLGGLQAALARTMRDPTLELAFAAPGGAGFVSPEGQPFLVREAPGRTATRLERDGELLAVVVHDAALERDDPSLLRAAGSVAGLALENERLQAQVRAQLEEVRASRQRIVEAGDAERRRVERDLHDGAQQRLVALAMRLDAARGASGDVEALLAQASGELGLAIDEVRSLSRGERPAPAGPS